ncbi:1 3-beta-glucanosyltransferase gel4 [Sorochytrium milnesiophthora]
MARPLSFTLAILLSILACQTAHAGPNPIVVKGTKFFDKVSGEQFILKGVAYQPQYGKSTVDPIANARSTAWTRDLKLLKDLGANVVRVYDVDNTAAHDQFMAALASNNMYLLLDLASSTVPNGSIDRSSPAYTVDIPKHFLGTIDAFAQYDNVLGFIVGNEVSDMPGNVTRSASYVKALLRDLRQYMSSKPRYIPLGYAASDNANTRVPNMDYFTCGKDAEIVDFYGSNLYSWCAADTTFESSGYADRTKELASAGVPIILSEFGCNSMRPRSWPDVPAIYGPQMSDVVSGAIAYEYSEEDNHFGLVKVNSPDDTNPQTLPDYDNLKKAWAAVSPKTVKMNAYQPAQRNAPACPAVNDAWQSESNNLPATPDPCVCANMVAGLSCTTKPGAFGSDADAATQLGQVCGKLGDSGCGDLSTKYAGCTLGDKLSWVYNEYYNKNGKTADACNWGGSGQLAAASTPAPSCQSLIPAAGSKQGNSNGPSNSAASLSACALTTTTTAAAAALLLSFV